MEFPLAHDNPLLTWEDPSPTKQPSHSWKRRAVSWFLDSNTPPLHKIAAVATILISLGMLATFNPLIGSLTTLSVILIFGWARGEVKREQGMKLRDIQEAQREVLDQETALKKMKLSIGGEKAWQKLPILLVGKEVSAAKHLDFLIPNMMRSPVMRGEAVDGRPFIAIKLQEDGGVPFVATFHQKHQRGASWVNGSYQEGKLRKYMDSPFVNQKIRELIHQVVVKKNHPHLKLNRSFLPF